MVKMMVLGLGRTTSRRTVLTYTLQCNEILSSYIPLLVLQVNNPET